MRESFKDPRQRRARNADTAVGDREPQCARNGGALIARDAQGDTTGDRELDRVADQVEQDLPDPRRIADQVRGHVWCDLALEGQPFFLGPGRHHLHQPRREVAQ